MLRAAAHAFSQLLRRKTHLIEHGIEQVGLVGKVPIHRTARDAGVSGDMFEAAVGNAFLQKQRFSGLQDGNAGFLGFFFGSAHGGRRITG